MLAVCGGLGAVACLMWRSAMETGLWRGLGRGRCEWLGFDKVGLLWLESRFLWHGGGEPLGYLAVWDEGIPYFFAFLGHCGET